MFDEMRPKQRVCSVFSTSDRWYHDVTVCQAVFAGHLSILQAVVNQIFQLEFPYICPRAWRLVPAIGLLEIIGQPEGKNLIKISAPTDGPEAEGEFWP
jgi:hypothetical protein